MIDYLYEIDEQLKSVQCEIDDFKQFIERGHDINIFGEPIGSANYIDNMQEKMLLSEIGYECMILELHLRALRDKLNDQT